jgi:O-antigen/teichoic acid export membrane protein
MTNKLQKGAFFLSIANFLCKILGVLYLIPWIKLMGSQHNGMLAQALYNTGYIPYALFLSLGTIGLPSVIAKKIAISSKKSDINEIKSVFTNSNSMMLFIGAISALAMYIFAPLLIKMSPVTNLENGISVIRSLCPSLLIIPLLSSMRGYFQGVSDLLPFAISLIVEQFIRVLVILVGSYYYLRVASGTIFDAVLISTQASFYGGLSVVIYLFFIGRKKGYFGFSEFCSPFELFYSKNRISTLSIFKETLPFMYVGATVTIFQLLDQVSIKPIFHFFQNSVSNSQIELLFSLASVNPNKLTAILISMVATVGTSSLPILSGLSKRNRLKIEQIISQSYLLTFTMLIPASIGMVILSEPMYTVFFGYDTNATLYMIISIGSAIFISLTTVQLIMLQALNHHKKAVRLVTIGIITKVIFQIILIYLFNGYGIVLSTTIPFIYIFISSSKFIDETYSISSLLIIKKQIYSIFRSSTIMAIICVFLLFFFENNFDLTRTFDSLLCIIVIAAVGVCIFLILNFKTEIKFFLFKEK